MFSGVSGTRNDTEVIIVFQDGAGGHTANAQTLCKHTQPRLRGHGALLNDIKAVRVTVDRLLLVQKRQVAGCDDLS